MDNYHYPSVMPREVLADILIGYRVPFHRNVTMTY